MQTQENTQNITQELLRILPQNYKIESQNQQTQLNIQKLSQDIQKKDSQELLKHILTSNMLTNHFFTQITPTHSIFKQQDFLNFLSQNYKNLNQSLTNFKNKIGLAIANVDTNQHLYFNQNSNIVLDFPFKDCVLVGGQSKDESKTEELFFHEVLDSTKINKLLSPKAFQNAKRILPQNQPLSTNAMGGITFNRNSHGTIKDNLLIKGNNLIALHTLKQEFSGKVKLIYIDPPYNTKNDSFKYNDRFKHSTWLTFMKNRLEVAKDLLREDGVIFVQIDDNEQAYLKVLMDEIFGRDNFVNTISLKSKVSAGASGGGEDIKIKKNIEYIHIYSISTSIFNGFFDLYKITELGIYIKQMKYNNKSFKYTQILYSEGNKEYFTTIKDGKDEDIVIYKHNEVQIKSVNEISKIENISDIDVYIKYFDKIMTTTNAQTSIRKKVWDCTDSDNTFYSAIYNPISGRDKGKITTLYFMGKNKVLIIWLKNTAFIGSDGKIYKKEKYGTFWDGIDYNNINKDGSVDFTNGKKPESLLQRIIEMSTTEGDIVLDFFAGSGTTPAVAHKMKRQWIAIEQMDYIQDITKLRLQKVIEGEQGGISKALNWQGGGDFIYLELAKYNQNFVESIQNTESTQELFNFFKSQIQPELATKILLNYHIETQSFLQNETDFLIQNLQEAKELLITNLNLNMLYIPNSLKQDPLYNLTQSDIQTTKNFYKEEK
jgi:adenine-specific DNA-methyltransferase